jgi:hypothetical protein
VERRDRYRRKFVYPMLTLFVAGIVYFLSKGQIASTAPAQPADYQTFAREVMYEVRGGRPIPKAVDPAIQQVFDTMAPASVRREDGGALTFEHIGPTQPGANLPHIQSVVVRAADGQGVSLALSILGGNAEVVGVARVDPIAAVPSAKEPQQ